MATVEELAMTISLLTQEIEDIELKLDGVRTLIAEIPPGALMTQEMLNRLEDALVAVTERAKAASQEAAALAPDSEQLSPSQPEELPSTGTSEPQAD